jgi:hypothetical protein
MKKLILSTAVVLGLTGAAFAQTSTDRTLSNGDNVAKTVNGNTVDKTVTGPNGKSMTIDKTKNGNQVSKSVQGADGKGYTATSTYGKNGVAKTQTANDGKTRSIARRRVKVQ